MRIASVVAAAAALCACVLPQAEAQLAPGLTYDDGFAWFSVDTETDARDGKPYAKGWVLKGEFRIFGQAPDHGAFRMVVKRGASVVADVRKEATIYHRRPPAFDDAEDMMWSRNVRDREQIVAGDGPFTVEVYYVDGATGAEALARTHTLDVRKVSRVRGNGEPDADDYYVSRHAEAVSAVIYQRPAEYDPYIRGDRGGGADRNCVEVYLGLSAVKDAYTPPRGYLRCTVDGAPLDLSAFEQYPNKDAVKSETAPDRFYEVVHTAAGNVKESINFRQYHLTLPLTWGEPGSKERDPNKPAITDHPGTWVCTWMDEGQALRTFTFVVGPDGAIAPHPEEAHGLRFGPGAHFVGVGVPPGGSALDERLVPSAVASGGFYGHAWVTPEAQGLASVVPEKGKPEP